MATKLVSMKQNASDRQESLATAPGEKDSGPVYPYGLSITLDNEALEKLGLDVSDLTVGESKLLIAKVEITAISSNQYKGGDENQSASLQITDCCLEDAPKGKSATASLYGSDEA